jgi:hypothetical protein
MDYILREIAISMDLDPDKLTNSLPDAAIQAEILKQFRAPAAEAAPPEGGPPAPPNPAGAEAPMGQGPQAPSDMSGGGGANIGIGGAAAPGEQGFSGNVQ